MCVHQRLRDLLGDEAALAHAGEQDRALALQASPAEPLDRLVVQALEECIQVPAQGAEIYCCANCQGHAWRR